ncbi:MAG: hypothetical protein U0359_39390 [Byssovorax sp.]
MSYDSRIEGALALHPFPDAEVVAALREALRPLGSPGAGRVVLTPLGHGLVVEETLDWDEGLAAIERARATVFAPRGIALAGVLRAIGEDGAHLATISIDAEGVRVEHHEDEGDDEDEDDEDEDDEDDEDEDDEDEEEDDDEDEDEEAEDE